MSTFPSAAKAALAAGALAAVTLAGPASAGAAPADPAFRALPCASTTTLLGSSDAARNARFSAQVVAGFNPADPDNSIKVADRNLKTLKLRSVTKATFGANCRADLDFAVTLERKVRRNASGTMKTHGTLVLKVNPATVNLFAATASVQPCIQDLFIEDFNLSNTLNAGELAYKLAANRNLPKELCLAPSTVSLIG
ncbi:MAG: hypothetical protein JHD16_17990 [Solirubrobacteraceae bacterium]|nr:hypothetical protein [Solirubrobacteraceae bacterium]